VQFAVGYSPLISCFIFCVKRGFILRMFDFRPCSRWQLLMVLLSTTIPTFANPIERFLHEALLFLNTTALIFQSSLSCCLSLPFTFSHPWTVYLPSQFQINLTPLTVWIDTFTSLAISFCLRSLCLSKTVICPLFLGLNSFIFTIFLTSLKKLQFCLCLFLSHLIVRKTFKKI